MLVWKLRRQIWTYNLFLVSIRKWRTCVNISQKVFKKDQCLQAMKQAANEVFENNKYHPDTMRIIAKAYLGTAH